MKEKALEFIKVHKYRLLLILVMLLYTIISFYKLGNNYNPQTFVNLRNNEYLVYKIDNTKVVSRAMFYVGPNTSYVTCYFADDIENETSWTFCENLTADYANILKWNEYTIPNSFKYNYLIIKSYWDDTLIGEVQFYDQDGNVIKLEPIDDRSKRLVDEQEDVPKEYSYMNSTYFDEVYFPRTVYEIMNNKSIYEYTHPPLGKLIMSIPVYFMGLTPFSYRLMGNISGILMILVMYEIAVAMFKKEKYGLFAAIIMALDGMHFVQTRIGTVDGYLVLFCMTSFLFFYKYLTLDKNEHFKQKIISLLISGAFWGMAISVKWTAFFFGVGLGILWLYEFIFKDNYCIKGKFNPAIVLWSILGFVIIPGTIYVTSYIPIINNPNAKLTCYTPQKDVENGAPETTSTIQIHDVKSFIDYQKGMYTYHAELQKRKDKNNEKPHPFSSNWYSWPIIERPLWFYSATTHDEDNNEKYGTIACMGNPAIWWLGIGTTIFTLIYSVIKRNKEGLMIIVLIAATWLTYAFVDREMYIYHYFITLPFVMLTIVFMASRLIEWKKSLNIIMPILCVIFLGFFIYFYPVYSGIPSDPYYIKSTEWFERWLYCNYC